MEFNLWWLWWFGLGIITGCIISGAIFTYIAFNIGK